MTPYTNTVLPLDTAQKQDHMAPSTILYGTVLWVSVCTKNENTPTATAPKSHFHPHWTVHQNPYRLCHQSPLQQPAHPTRSCNTPIPPKASSFLLSHPSCQTISVPAPPLVMRAKTIDLRPHGSSHISSQQPTIPFVTTTISASPPLLPRGQTFPPLSRSPFSPSPHTASVSPTIGR